MAPEREADVSIRHCIRWLSSSSSGTDNPPPSEPTSTIVLTSPSGRFVDLRILKQDPSSTDHASVFSQTEPKAEEAKSKTLPVSRLDWAIAGTSTHTPTRPTIGYYGQKLILPDGRTVNGSVADLKKGKYPYVRGRWTHWVDSRVVYSADSKNGDEAPADEGDMYRMPEDQRLTLEKGRMVNPKTGREEEYEEVWGPDDDDEEGEEGSQSRCVVWEIDDEAGSKKGRIVRVGRWTQGILRRGDELLCERWKLMGAGGEDKERRWKLDARVGGYFGGEEGRKLDDKDETLAFPEALVDMMITAGEPGKERKVGDTVKGSNGDVWTLMECGP